MSRHDENKAGTRNRLDNEQRTYTDIDDQTYVKVTDDDLSIQLHRMNCILADMLEEQKKTNIYLAMMNDHNL